MSNNWFYIDTLGNDIKKNCESNCPDYSFNDISIEGPIYYCADSISFGGIIQRFMNEIISNFKINNLPEPIDTRGQIRFIIDTDGEIIRPLIYDSISPDIDKQILGLISKWGKLQIGYCKGHPVPVLIIIPFQIEYK